MSYTKGEWEPGSDYGRYMTEIVARGHQVCLVRTKRTVGVYSDEKSVQADPEGCSNLDLIAAAPELAEALTRLVKYLGGAIVTQGARSDMMQAARAALAKAGVE